MTNKCFYFGLCYVRKNANWCTHIHSLSFSVQQIQSIFSNCVPFFRSLKQPCSEKRKSDRHKEWRKQTQFFTIIDKLFDFVVLACLFVSRCVCTHSLHLCLFGYVVCGSLLHSLMLVYWFDGKVSHLQRYSIHPNQSASPYVASKSKQRHMKKHGNSCFCFCSLHTLFFFGKNFFASDFSRFALSCHVVYFSRVCVLWQWCSLLTITFGKSNWMEKHNTG